MTEEFRQCFVGEKGYETLKKLMRSGNEFSTEIAKCLQERSDAETAYVRALRKNGDTLQKLAGRAKGTLSTAFTILAAQTSKESDAHSAVANILLSEISMPMKNLAEAQYKERKLIEDTLNGKFKEWNDAKDVDNKYRSRQFEKSREIESLYLKISELPKTSRKMARDPTKMEMSIRRAEEDLEKIERKYHDSTRNVESVRQLCAAELCRGCNQMQKMELERINEMDKYIHIYANAIRTLAETTNQVSHELNSIQVLPNEDIIIEARSNLQTTEIEILLYDIYAEYEQAMGEQRRILSLMRWIDMLKKDVDIQRRSNNVSAASYRDGSSPSSNDDDGAMRREKDKKQGKKKAAGFSSEMFIDQPSTHLFQCLYEASLYKIESVYNRIKNLPEKQYEHENCFTKTYNDKGDPTTLIRIPLRSSIDTPPSAPSATKYFAEVMPMFIQPIMQQPPMIYATQRQAPPMALIANDTHMKSTSSGRK
ncbi:unnamed protein product [Rotaria sp. Silwood2]|nr:unnamed protein product [Rotaria sp. Silwood2]CAF2978342.1 unnamed protein product [Rotaria sp. Silwood2]CAF3277149.1 unnamed protein product [Rotaria sp. Silwood2]CAF3283606.1 unnamed protein product [Rotaria sp. Silwood2]CAF4060116.1 unnamed protein product [Rotaria sp. Silwood2]